MVLLNIPYKEKKITARLDSLDETEDVQNKIWIVLTHGAGGDLNAPQLAAVAAFLSKLDFIVFRFTCKGLNIKYRINVFAEMLKFICKSYNPKGIFVGGRSMGARAAVMITEEDVMTTVFEKILGIICLSYPLHKVNSTKDLRDGPLIKCKKPVFFLSGTRDEMCKKEILENILLNLKVSYKIQWLGGYNHSAKSSNNFEDDTYTIAFQTLHNWCKSVSSRA